MRLHFKINLDLAEIEALASIAEHAGKFAFQFIGETIMGQIKDSLDGLRSDIEAETTEVTEGFTSLNTKIDELKAQVESVGDPVEILATIEELRAKVKGVFNPAAPVEPTPVPPEVPSE